MRRSPAEVALAIGVLALGVMTAVGTAFLPSEGGYARIGPNVIPALAAVGLIILGLVLLYEALTGRWGGPGADDPEARGEHAFSVPAFAWITAGLFAHMVLIASGAFVLAGVALFAGVARGFGSAHVARDAAVGLALSLGVFQFFTRFLGVSLPAGWLVPAVGL